ncbi:MAG: hypothetical protein MI794_13705 [Pseudomonadales bacterium]|nr:hypothetical protein [Pseudomonadales bacterium]
MIKKTLVSSVLFSLLLSSGCAHLGGTYFKRSYVSIEGDDDDTIGTILVWEADTSAAVLLDDGKACMQTALAVKTADVEAQAKISESLLELSKTAALAQENPENVNQPLADVTTSIKEAAQALTTTTERTAFLNIGMFYLCQIAANGSVNENNTSLIAQTLIKSASGIE